MTNSPITINSPEIVDKIKELISKGESPELIDYDEIIYQAYLQRADVFHANNFNLAAEAYEKKFGNIPYGLEYPEITVERLLKAVESGKKIIAYRLPKDAVA